MKSNRASESDGQIRPRVAQEQLVDFGKIGLIVRKNWLVYSRDRATLMAMLFLPMILITIYGSTSGVTPKGIPVGFVDYDHSQTSAQLLNQLYSVQTVTVVRLIGSQDQAKRMLDEGAIKAAFVVPPGFEAGLYSENPPQLQLIMDPTDPASQVTQSVAAAVGRQLYSSLSARQLQAAQADLGRASAQLALGRQLLAPDAVFAQRARASAASSSASLSQAARIRAGAQAALSAAVIAQRNGIGVIIDPNVFLYTPAAVTDQEVATNAYLLTLAGQQQQVLAQIALYQGMEAQFAIMARDSGQIYSSYQSASGQSGALAARAGVAEQSIAASQTSLESASVHAANSQVQAPIKTVVPYGSTLPPIEFLIASILVLTVFQAAAGNLGRAIVGERENGSLTRVFLTPTSSTTIILGTQLFYILIEIVRSSFFLMLAVLFFNVQINGSILEIEAIIALFAIGTTGVGMMLSTLANNLWQYQATSMLIFLPVTFLSGVFIPIQTLPGWLQSVASLLPLASASYALTGVMVKGLTIWQVMPQLAYLALFAAAMLVGTILLFKREIA